MAEVKLWAVVQANCREMERISGVPHITISRQCRGLRKSRGKIKFVKIKE